MVMRRRPLSYFTDNLVAVPVYGVMYRLGYQDITVAELRRERSTVESRMTGFLNIRTHLCGVGILPG